MDYESLRQFADSWGLLYLFIIFLGIVIFVFRPGAKHNYDKHANIPLKRD